MKLPIIPPLNINSANIGRGDFAALPGERPQDEPPTVRAGSRELVFTAFIRKEGVNLREKGTAIINPWIYSDLRRAFDRLCEVIRLQGYKGAFTVTLKIEPVHGAAKVNAS
jgi:hypothetical protein